MKRRCRILRERAFLAGVNSNAAAGWRVHCRTCAECRTELYVLETLERQAHTQRHHLPQHEVATLLQAVQKRYRPKRRLTSVWTWTARLACVCIVIVMAGEFAQYKQADTSLPANSFQPQAAGASETGAGNAAAATDATPAALAAPPPDTLKPGWPAGCGSDRVGQRMHELRRRTNTRRNTLLELIDDDLGERTRKDAWDSTLISVATVV